MSLQVLPVNHCVTVIRGPVFVLPEVKKLTLLFSNIQTFFKAPVHFPMVSVMLGGSNIPSSHFQKMEISKIISRIM